MDETATSNKNTTLFRECLGLFGALVWFFCSMYSYEDTLFEDSFYIPAFLLMLLLSMLVFGICNGGGARLQHRLILLPFATINLVEGAVSSRAFLHLMPKLQ